MWFPDAMIVVRCCRWENELMLRRKFFETLILMVRWRLGTGTFAGAAKGHGLASVPELLTTEQL